MILPEGVKLGKEIIAQDRFPAENPESDIQSLTEFDRQSLPRRI
jgi:hypothetical protein